MAISKSQLQDERERADVNHDRWWAAQLKVDRYEAVFKALAVILIDLKMVAPYEEDDY